MKKIVIVLFLAVFSVLSFYAADADSTTNVNNALLDNWSKCATITLSGVAPLPIVYKVENIASLTITKDGTLIIKGKEDKDGAKWDLWHIKYYAAHVDIKQTTDKKTNTKTFNMFVYGGSYPPVGKGMF